MQMKNRIHIKNMVCPRCIAAVEGLLADLAIDAEAVMLGEVILTAPLQETTKTKLASGLRKLGFELLQPGKSALISRIKSPS